MLSIPSCDHLFPGRDAVSEQGPGEENGAPASVLDAYTLPSVPKRLHQSGLLCAL